MKELVAPSKCFLVKNLIKHEFKESLFKLSKMIHLNKVDYLNEDIWEIPKSSRVEKILNLANELYEPALLNHGLRSYSFGKMMMKANNERVDDEVFFVGSLLHDLGLMRDCTHTTFEVAGAKEACSHCKDDFEARELDLIHEMIMYHDAIGVAESKSLELKYLHYGAGIDVADLWTHRLHEENYNEVFERYPGKNHISVMIELMKKRMKDNPKMYLSTLINLGFYEKMKSHRHA
ncbi:hypothetical protein HBN50_01455 [Halobacteriovorax sp. GB3]|uniref:hypothetical protein n=1 Tax=Halobacteriovorax sp. GB3 TaxID=2719615 RepID=UPI00235E8BA4|nr:hypothetical protein [Halobacteriovorax sp. GB3]MDD0851735.1 hypothetical protein [Halobacteriovorax sp. GB3]